MTVNERVSWSRTRDEPVPVCALIVTVWAPTESLEAGPQP